MRKPARGADYALGFGLFMALLGFCGGFVAGAVAEAEAVAEATKCLR